MKAKKFGLIFLFLLIATALPTCKRKESPRPKKPERSALHKAALDEKRTADVKRMLENGADIDSRDYEGMTPLHLVAFLGHERTARLLIHRGADVNAMNDKGETALHLAAEGGWLEIIKLLLEAGADINIKTKEGKTPLGQANQKISILEKALQLRPPLALKGIARQAREQLQARLQRYKDCAEVLRKHGAK
ncbi:MAG: ankyrin repeat domain-containing protein [Planctomycetota bacterium]|jgi:ankyrin repeat protein